MSTSLPDVTASLDCTRDFIDLPLCRLHVMCAGDGPPLIMLPATISELDNYIEMARFMGQWFHVYFFELPGHGESEAFQEPFSSQLLAEMVEQLVDHLGLERFNLMGFSFGGILAMRTFQRLHDRIDRLCLLAPCLTRRAMPLSNARVTLLRSVAQQIGRPRMLRLLLGMCHSPYLAEVIGRSFRAMGKVEQTIPIGDKLRRMRASTLEVLCAQVEEILTAEFPPPPVRYQTPCYFAMSVNDPLLDFETTLAAAGEHYAEMTVLRLDYPFHQPPQPFTFDELNRDFHETVEAFVRTAPVAHS